MLDVKEARRIVEQELPGEKINSYIEYKNLFIFQVFSNRPMEEELDPFYSVNKETGEFRDFSILLDGVMSEVLSLFVTANKNAGSA